MFMLMLLFSCSNEVAVSKLEQCRLGCDRLKKRTFNECTRSGHGEDRCRKEAKENWTECIEDCKLRWVVKSGESQ